MRDPLVTVLMPVYNAEKYLREAIDSILNQTFRDYEFLIIDDGSTDESNSIIKSYKDERIRLIENGQNIKLIATLNKGIDLARGKYIARMDADDISLPERLQRLVDFMEANSDTGLCGSFLNVMGSNNDRVVKFRTTHEEITFRLFFTNCLAHPTIMLRKSVLTDNNLHYPGSLHAEDYSMWVKMSRLTRLAVIPEVLLTYRVHDSNISEINKNWQHKISESIRHDQILELIEEIDNQSLKLYENFIIREWPNDLENTLALIDLFSKLIFSNNRKNILPKAIFAHYFSQYIMDLFLNNSQFGMPIYKKYKTIKKQLSLKNKKLIEVKFYMRCLIRKRTNFTKPIILEF